MRNTCSTAECVRDSSLLVHTTVGSVAGTIHYLDDIMSGVSVRCMTRCVTHCISEQLSTRRLRFSRQLFKCMNAQLFKCMNA